MAADQRRKRMSSASIIGLSSREHYRAKKKKMASPNNVLNTRDHISLEWDGKQKKVVAKREQVGLSLRDLHPFVDYVPCRRNILADVCMIPHEIFERENLSDVLSYEVWQTHLSEEERNHLRQFLPRGVDAEQVVQALLDGDNFHFGNPFLHWGSAVCSGNLHPDGIRSMEDHLKTDKRRYYSELQKYHYDIIDYLQKLKDKWESCKDPEKDIVQKMWGRSRGDTAHVGNSEQDLTAGSESCSWDADEKQCSSDNKNSPVLKTRGVQKRSKGFAKTVGKETFAGPLIASDNVPNVGAKPRKKEKLPRHSIQQTDGAKYMSYLKISKKQHQIVTSMKQSGKSIQSRALNRILGNINKLDVQPYGLFVEEERQKLNSHWLQLVKCLPAAYEFWKELQSQKREITKSLERELKNKLNPWMEDEQKSDPTDSLQDKDDVHMYSSNDDTEEENQESLVPNPDDVVAPDHEPDVEDSGDSGQILARNQSTLQESSSYGGHEFELKDVERVGDSGCCSQLASSVSSPNGDDDVKVDGMEDKPCSFTTSLQNKHSPTNNHDEIVPKGVEVGEEYSYSLQNQSLPQVSSVSGNCALIGSELENVSSVIDEHSMNERIPGIASSCGGDVWPAVGIGQSYIAGGLPIINSQGEEEAKTCFINLGSNVRKEIDAKNVLQQRQLVDGPFGCSFPSHDQGELLQSMFKGQGIASHNLEPLHSLIKGPGIASNNQEPKQMMGIDFRDSGNFLMDSSQFSGHFQNQIPPSQTLAQDQRRQNDIYGEGSIPENIYCDGGGGYLMQGQESLRQGRLHNWDTSSARIGGVAIQPQLSSGQLLSPNWLPGEHRQQQLRSIWTNSNGVQSGPNQDQSLLRGGGNADQSLFSVLSQCNQMQSSETRLESVVTSEEFIPPKDFGMMLGGGTSQIPQVRNPNPFDYLNGGNAPASLVGDNIGWMNQNSVHDTLGKIYPRSWNE